MTSPSKQDRLRLRAEDEEDLAVLSACLQDALVAVRDIVHLPAERRLVMVVNRYRWEKDQDPAAEGPAERVLCAVAMEGVRQVRRRGIDQGRPGHLLSVLAIRPSDTKQGMPTIEIVFSGQAAVRVDLDRLQLRAEDVEEPYPTAWRPRHKLDDSATGAS
jgi:hypothetical protein